MSRHRNVRSMNYKDEYDGYDDVYGHSVEDDSCISPSDADQWLYDRARNNQHGIGSYLDANKDIPEEDEEIPDDFPRKDSINLPELSSLDKARLASCLEGIRNVIGDTVPEKTLAGIVIKHNFDLTTSLDAVLNQDHGERRASVDADLKSISDKTKKPLSMKDLMAASSRPSNLFNRVKPKPQENITNSNQKPESTPKFNSLAELTSFHLNNQPKKFTIPKFQMKKVPENIKLKPSNELDNFHIDLTTALKTVDTNLGFNPGSKPDFNPGFKPGFNPGFKPGINPSFKPEFNPGFKPVDKSTVEDDFVPQFIDCDIIQTEHNPLDDCCMNLSYILDYNTRSIRKKRTRFGKSLNIKYRYNNLPKIEHKFNFLNDVQPFKFDVPSPDDAVQKYVRR